MLLDQLVQLSRDWIGNRITDYHMHLGFPGGSDGKESACNMGDLGLIPHWEDTPGGGHSNPLQYSCLENPNGQMSLAGYSPWSCKKWLSTHTHKYLGFPGGSDGKESICNMGDLGSIPELGRSPGERNGNPPRYACLENPMDRGAQRAAVLGVAKSWTRLSYWV